MRDLNVQIPPTPTPIHHRLCKFYNDHINLQYFDEIGSSEKAKFTKTLCNLPKYTVYDSILCCIHNVTVTSRDNVTSRDHVTSRDEDVNVL